MTQLEVLYEDESCLAVLKPAGLSTQAPRVFDSLELRVRAMLASRPGAGGELYLGLPHRLDRPVSGVVLLAKTRRAARVISRQFERRHVKKTYWGIVEGAVTPEQGTWSDFVCKLPGEPRGEVVPATHAEAQKAILHYRVLRGVGPNGADRSAAAWTWLEIDLETGRMHQVRLQAESRGHPLLGDTLYGSTTPFGPPVADAREQPIALHARSLSFVHPETNERVIVTAPTSVLWTELGEGF